MNTLPKAGCRAVAAFSVAASFAATTAGATSTQPAPVPYASVTLPSVGQETMTCVTDRIAEAMGSSARLMRISPPLVAIDVPKSEDGKIAYRFGTAGKASFWAQTNGLSQRGVVVINMQANSASIHDLNPTMFTGGTLALVPAFRDAGGLGMLKMNRDGTAQYEPAIPMGTFDAKALMGADKHPVTLPKNLNLCLG